MRQTEMKEAAQQSGNVKPLARSAVATQQPKPLARPAVAATPPKPTHQPIITAQDPDALLKAKETGALVGMSVANLYRKVRAGAFPKPLKIGTRCTRWRSGDVRAWIHAQKEGAQ